MKLHHLLIIAGIAVVLCFIARSCNGEEWVGIKEFKTDYEAWCYFNLKKDLGGGAIGIDGGNWNGGFQLYDFDGGEDIEEWGKSNFGKDFNNLEKKWRGKPEPKGFKEFCERWGIERYWIKVQEIDDALINAIICVESGWDANAVSPKGCIGLMQINPNGALKEYNQQEYPAPIEIKDGYAKGIHWGAHWLPEALFIPEINIEIGRWYLNRLKDHYIPKDKFSLELLLSAYNAGPTYMRKVNWDIKRAPSETKRYIRRVISIYKNGE